MPDFVEKVFVYKLEGILRNRKIPFSIVRNSTGKLLLPIV